MMDALQAGLLDGQRRALAKAITLLESTRPADRVAADALLTAVLPHTGRSLRLGISGVPGVGKSTFIDTLGLHLVGLGRRVAVLAVDPSSTVSGGAILGDKTRMDRLAVHPQAFIRPSPSGGTLGGVAEKTRETILLCEAAGYDTVLIETVGVGQSEIAVAGMSDVFVLLQLPNAGDELQAIKRGVMEWADLVVVNKADLDLTAAQRAQAHLVATLQGLSRRRSAPWIPPALLLSGLQGQGLAEFWAQVLAFEAQQRQTGGFEARRQHQAWSWMQERLQAGLLQSFHEHPAVRALWGDVRRAIEQGQIAPSTAARQLLAAYQAA